MKHNRQKNIETEIKAYSSWIVRPSIDSQWEGLQIDLILRVEVSFVVWFTAHITNWTLKLEQLNLSSNFREEIGFYLWETRHHSLSSKKTCIHLWSNHDVSCPTHHEFMIIRYLLRYDWKIITFFASCAER